MFQRHGASLISTLAALCLGVGALGAAGYSLMNGGFCSSCASGTCSVESNATVLAIANEDEATESSSSCCPLGSLAAQGEKAEVIAASDEKSCASSCSKSCSGAQTIATSSDKNCASSCSKSCSGAAVVAASDEKACASSCSDKDSRFAAPVVLQASFPIMMPAMQPASMKTASCGSACNKGEAVQTIATSLKANDGNCASACGSACPSKGAESAAMLAASTKAKTCSGSSCSKSSCDKPAMQTVANTASCAASCTSSCSGKATMAMIDWTVVAGIVRPAAFINAGHAGSCSSACGSSCSSKATAQPVSNDSGCCKGTGERADGKECCGGCTKDKSDEAEPVAAAN